MTVSPESVGILSPPAHISNGSFLPHLPAVNELHMVPGARSGAPGVACSASLLTIGQTLPSDFICSPLQGVLAFDSAKKKVSEERRLPARSCTLTPSCYERGSRGVREEFQNSSDAGESSAKLPRLAVFWGGFMWGVIFHDSTLKKGGVGLSGPRAV